MYCIMWILFKLRGGHGSFGPLIASSPCMCTVSFLSVRIKTKKEITNFTKYEKKSKKNSTPDLRGKPKSGKTTGRQNRRICTMWRMSTKLTSSNLLEKEVNRSDYKITHTLSQNTKIVKLKMKNYGEESLRRWSLRDDEQGDGSPLFIV